MKFEYLEYDDQYPTCHSTHATLCIYVPDTEIPDAVSERLGIRPSESQVKGELRSGKKKQWPTAWFLESEPNVESKDVRRHINWLLDQLDGKAGVVQQLMSEGYEIHISCFWTSAKGHGGPMLDPIILKRLAELELGIDFDIYFEGDEVHEFLRPGKV